MDWRRRGWRSLFARTTNGVVLRSVEIAACLLPVLLLVGKWLEKGVSHSICFRWFDLKRDQSPWISFMLWNWFEKVQPTNFVDFFFRISGLFKTLKVWDISRCFFLYKKSVKCYRDSPLPIWNNVEKSFVGASSDHLVFGAREVFKNWNLILPTLKCGNSWNKNPNTVGLNNPHKLYVISGQLFTSDNIFRSLVCQNLKLWKISSTFSK